MQRMTRLDYRLGFTTPAFLGGADQAAQWRSPPFKALLRQWWRVLNAREFGYRHERLREAEGRLFGNAWLEGDADSGQHRKSDVRLRLTPEAELRALDSAQWPKRFEPVPTAPGAKVSADLYLGYGPVVPPSRKEGRPHISIPRGAIPPGVFARLTISAPPAEKKALEEILAFIAWFGAVGSRSRNGWGSLVLLPGANGAAVPMLDSAAVLASGAARPWQECLRLDWPHAIGLDDNGLPLVWRTSELQSWQHAIEKLANVKVRLRTVAKRIRDGNVGAIHYLGYPAGTGGTNPWALRFKPGPEGRLASQLRFKVERTEAGKVRGLVVHTPCAVPEVFLNQLAQDRDRRWLADHENQRSAWAEVHDALRDDRDLTQLGAEA